MAQIERRSYCKINLVLNILGKRPDGFHELETLMCPVALHDTLHFTRIVEPGITLTCTDPNLPTDSANLVHRAATRFFHASSAPNGVRIHLVKRIPLAAGLGGGSGNAAVTLLTLNEMFERPLSGEKLRELAAELGSDVPFFLETVPALATGRGERLQALGPLVALENVWVLLVHPGFGVSTAWAYRALAGFPDSLNGTPGRADECARKLRQADVAGAMRLLYNSLEAPVLRKHPLLRLLQEFFRQQGSLGTLMSGSGSTTFALTDSERAAEALRRAFTGHFGEGYWTTVTRLGTGTADT